MSTSSEELEELGFDDNADLCEDDVVVLQGEDGVSVEHVLLAVIEVNGDTFALLTPRALVDADEPGDLLVVRYVEEADGAARFEPLVDASVLPAVQEAMANIVELSASV